MSLFNTFLRIRQYNPYVPEAEWELVWEKTDGGSYTTSEFGWGQYKIVISGGGGAGGAYTGRSGNYGVANGSAGEEKTIIHDIIGLNTESYTGVVGSGAKGSAVRKGSLEQPYIVGAIGTGYSNGATGSGNYEIGAIITSVGGDISYIAAYVVASGSGGGSTYISLQDTVAKGGNGGHATNPSHAGYVAGGAGGSGGTDSGTGASGGNGAARQTSSTHEDYTYSGAGSDGYVRIYRRKNYIPR